MTHLTSWQSLYMSDSRHKRRQRPILTQYDPETSIKVARPFLIGQSIPQFQSDSMTIKYLLLVNKQGQTRISKYYETASVENRIAMEADIIRKCLGRSDSQVRSSRYKSQSGLYATLCCSIIAISSLKGPVGTSCFDSDFVVLYD
jgi:hypothetical protein